MWSFSLDGIFLMRLGRDDPTLLGWAGVLGWVILGTWPFVSHIQPPKPAPSMPQVILHPRCQPHHQLTPHNAKCLTILLLPAESHAAHSTMHRRKPSLHYLHLQHINLHPLTRPHAAPRNHHAATKKPPNHPDSLSL